MCIRPYFISAFRETHLPLTALTPGFDGASFPIYHFFNSLCPAENHATSVLLWLPIACRGLRGGSTPREAVSAVARGGADAAAPKGRRGPGRGHAPPHWVPPRTAAPGGHTRTQPGRAGGRRGGVGSEPAFPSRVRAATRAPLSRQEPRAEGKRGRVPAGRGAGSRAPGGFKVRPEGVGRRSGPLLTALQQRAGANAGREVGSARSSSPSSRARSPPRALSFLGDRPSLFSSQRGQRAPAGGHSGKSPPRARPPPPQPRDLRGVFRARAPRLPRRPPGRRVRAAWGSLGSPSGRRNPHLQLLLPRAPFPPDSEPPQAILSPS
ncbi:PREDICTED: dapper homolog 3-like [Chinchilla lanigera]|uniref:dapper homolog 3-like n=1 Tax=Chinchilla lanigera TaxID=34839 RepID=UPI00069923F6|nr:PREDICTED: dapper homolog 3-like [Chinchilla lanigera]